MTSLLVNGERYELDSITDIPLGDLFVLKTFTKAKGYEAGVSLKSINAMFDTLRQRSESDSFDPMDLLDDVEYLVNMVGFVYCVRRSSGEQVTPAEVWASTTITSLEFADDEVEVDESAPKDESTLEPVPSVN